MKVYGLIGNPLGHSFSKQYFTQKFEAANLQDCRFELFPLEHISKLPELLSRENLLHGLAVTIPFKESVIQFLDETDHKAGTIAAVNCIKLVAGRLIGYNTDSTGFELSLLPLLKAHHDKALVLGTGGSSKAIQFVLRKLGIRFLVVTRAAQVDAGFINYSSVTEAILEQHPLIINCTPVGMYPDTAALPDIPYSALTDKHLLYDLIYKPEQTKFLAAGLAKGATIKNGYEMLVLQAEENWRIWNE